MEFYIQWCGALQWNRWRSYLKQLICSCLASYFSGKATKVGSPPNFPKLIAQLWGTLQPQYFVTLFLDPHWTYLWKYFIYYKKETKVGSQYFGYQIWFCTRLIKMQFSKDQGGTKPDRNKRVVCHMSVCLNKWIWWSLENNRYMMQSKITGPRTSNIWQHKNIPPAKFNPMPWA